MIGQTHEAALWYQTPEQRELAKTAICECFAADGEDHGLVFGPVTFCDADLNSRRAPKPPEEGAKLLLGEATVLGVKPTRGERFVLDLDTKSLNILRKVTQDAWMKVKGSKPLTIDEIDRVIAETSQKTIERMLEYAYEQQRTC